MNRIAIVSFVLMSMITSTRGIKAVDKKTYQVVYDERLEQPTKVAYFVECSKGKFSRDGLDFYLEPGVHTSNNADYKNNDWDKGHMAPAGSFSCNEENLNRTFSYVNCALQHKLLNRGVWKNLETYERELSIRERVNITIKIHFSKSSKVLKTGATIPDAFTKTIKRGKKTESFYFRNEAPKSSRIEDYLVR